MPLTRSRQRVLPRSDRSLRHAHAQPVFSRANSAYSCEQYPGFLDRNDGWASLRLATPASAVFSAVQASGGRRGIAAGGAPTTLREALFVSNDKNTNPVSVRKVSDISHPNLVGLAHRQPLDPVGKHRQSSDGEIGRAGIFRGLGSNSRSLAPATLPQTGPAPSSPLPGQCTPLSDKMQLQAPGAAALAPFLQHQRHHQLGLHHAALLRLASRVIILPGDPHPVAHPADAHPQTSGLPTLRLRCSAASGFFLNSATSAIPARRTRSAYRPVPTRRRYSHGQGAQPSHPRGESFYH